MWRLRALQTTTRRFSSAPKVNPPIQSKIGSFLKQKTVSYIGAPLAGGQPIPGVEKAPQALRDGGIANVVGALGWQFHDVGDVDVASAMVPGSGERVDGVKNCEKLGLANNLLHNTVRDEAMKGNFVLTIGGDHSIASATLTGMKAAHDDLCVVWVDAHADCNTGMTSPSGNYHGMPAAHAMGWFPNTNLPGFDWLVPEVMIAEPKLAFIALRDIDTNEKELLRKSGVAVFTMHEVDKWGIGSVVEMALHRVNPHNNRPIHLSFDIDGCDPSIAPGTGTCSRGGINFRESHYICETLAMTSNLVSMDVVEINPDLDEPVTGRMHGDSEMIKADKMTVRLGIELISSALGRSIL